MPAKTLDGKKLADSIVASLAERVADIKMPMHLGIVLVGEDPASVSYVGQKEKMGEKIGIPVEIFRYRADISTHKLREEVVRIGRKKEIRGLIVQLPLPPSINEARIVNAIPPEKDVDVLGKSAFGAFVQGTSPIVPPTVGAILRLLEEYDITLPQKNVVIVGAGRLVGLPMEIEATRQGATVCIINEDTQNPERITKEADIIVTGTPVPEHIGGDMLKEGVVVVDAGYARNRDGKATGNVKFEEVSKKASFITPVPGGIGPMTVAILFSNLVTLKRIT